jgi:hypothetical protein
MKKKAGRKEGRPEGKDPIRKEKGRGRKEEMPDA